MQDSIFIFRRDLRLHDNTSLIHALNNSKKVLPIFIFDPRQLSQKNKYFSKNAYEFMLQSLKDLNSQLKKHNSKLFVLKGEQEKIISSLLKTKQFSAVYSNLDYTPFSIFRDEQIQKECEKHDAPYIQFEDALLNSPHKTLKKDKTPYTIFTPFFNNAIKLKIQKPQENTNKNYVSSLSKIKFQGIPKIPSQPKTKSQNAPNSAVKNSTFFAGTVHAKKILSKLEQFKNYQEERDFPALNSTTHLSPHLKFGTISSRETYYTIKSSLGSSHPLIRQLYWRDFFTQIAYYFPHVFKSSFRKKYSKLKWSNSKTNLDKWKNAKTGFPIVDAAMRELNTTGFMQNRCRMIVSSFLTKDLHINWQDGEKYFAQKLIDYDPCVNNGNWQWAASTGCDAQPYFRIFNPWSQQKRFDADCKYIKKWIPELSNLTAKQIHNLETNFPKNLNYPKPILNHKEEAKKAIAMYKNGIA